MSFTFANNSNLSGPEWTPFAQALQQAKKQKKYVFIDFFADWCSFCHLLDNTSFRDSAIINELKNNFYPIRIDMESKVPIVWQGETMTTSDFSQKLGVVGLPCMVFLNHELEMIGSYSAYADSELLLNLLTFISSGSREKHESFEEFLNNKK